LAAKDEPSALTKLYISINLFPNGNKEREQSMNKKYVVSLIPTERKQIQAMANAQTVSSTIRKRANTFTCG
jgi:hypothetical protein